MPQFLVLTGQLFRGEISQRLEERTYSPKEMAQAQDCDKLRLRAAALTCPLPFISRFIDSAPPTKDNAWKSTCTRRIDLEGFSGESFLVFNR
jgi:hypothetical protein